jgi:hypothetical protein
MTLSYTDFFVFTTFIKFWKIILLCIEIRFDSWNYLCRERTGNSEEEIKVYWVFSKIKYEFYIY